MNQITVKSSYPFVSDPEEASAFRIPETKVAPIVQVAFYAFAASIPFETVDLGIPIEVTMFTLGFLVLSLIFQPTLCFRKLPVAFACFLIYVAIFSVPVFTERWPYSDEALWQFMVLVQLVLMCWISFNLLKSDKIARNALIVFATACSLLALLQVIGVSETTTNFEETIQRTTSFGFHPNNLARLLALGLLVLIGLTYGGVKRPLKSGIVVWLLFALIGFAIVETGSRGGLIAFLVGLSIILLRSGSITTRLRNAFLLVAGIGFFAFIAFESELFRSRFERAMDDGDLARREQIYPTAFAMFLEKPLFGWGGKGSEFELGARLAHEDEVSKNPHNLFLYTLVATGVVGTLPMLIGLILAGGAAWKARNGPRGVLPLSLFAMVIVANMSGLWLHNKMHWFVMAYSLSSVSVYAVRKVTRSRNSIKAKNNEFVESYV